MAVTTQMRTQVAQLYVSLFGRAPEAEGLSYWAKQLEAGKSFQTIAQDMFNVAPARDYYPSTFTNQEIVAKFYQNVLGRPADAQGLAYWTARLNTESTTGTTASKAIAVGTVITELLTAVVNYNGTDADAIKSQSLLANKVDVALFYGVTKADDAKIQAALVDKMATVAKDVIALVVPGATGAAAAKAYADPTHIFTLTESYTSGTPGSAGTKVVYWGYNPIAPGNGGTGAPETGGIPVEDLKSFLLTITGLDLKELGLIDADGKDPFQNVTSLTLSNPLSSGANTNGSGNNANQSSGNSLTISFADGTSLNAEVKLGEAYFKFLNDLLFDKNGNTRLFEKVIGATSGTESSLQPIKLTPAANNGGTLEEGYTTLGDDVIVAGRLELLHQAYIDGGAGFNVLEIDAKGTYAQPTQLLNIQEIRVTDLPNFYTTDYGQGTGNLENTNTNNSGFPVPAGTDTTDDSWIDLSRATALGNTVNGVKGKLIVTDQSVDSGNLTIVGVRNGATLRLEGNFGGGSTTIQYGVGQTGTLNMELAVGDVTAPINVLQNASSLNIDSQGIENHFHTFFAGGSVSNMTIKGTGVFGVDQDLFSSFNSGRPAVINASANTGGLDVTLNNHYNVKITGTAADDEITTNYTSSGTFKSVIVAGNGDNTITANGNGSPITTVSITSGTGNDVISALNGTNVTISAGDGNNNIIADTSLANANVSVTSGAGNDVIQVLTTQASGTAVVIDAGNGANKVTVSGADVTVTTGTGNDTVTINGTNNTFLNGDNNGSDNNGTDFVGTIANSGVLLKLDLGTGTNVLNLGRLSAGVVALEGSSITGSNITMFVENNSDLREATLTGITKVTMKQELTITDDQFKAIGANAFSTWHASYGATEDLRIVVDSNVVLTDLLNGKDLSANVRLNFELHNGATLTLTAEQLHKYVAIGGIAGADGLNGKVIINQAGANFDPFNSGNNYLVIDGGTISAGNLYGAEDVTIIRDGSYERPTTGPLQDSMTLGSATATADLTVANLVTEAQVLKLIGAQNIKFTGVVDLGGEVSLSGKDDVNNETDAFSVDFSAVTGKVTGLTLDHFQDVKSIRGNGQAGNRVDVILNGDVGSTGINQGLNTSGVETFMVTRIDTKSGNANGENGSVDGQFGDAAGSVTINLCDLTKDVKFIGLKGNVGNTLTLNSVPWGAVAPHIVLEGDGYANASQAMKVDGSPDTSDVGNIVANFYGSNATAVVDINNAGVELGTTTTGTERKFSVGGITLNNASTVTINVAQGDATIASVGGNSLSTLTFVGTEDVAVTSSLPSSVALIDASGVAGAFSATLVDPVDHKLSFVGGAGVANLTLNSVSISATLGADYGSSIVGGTGGVNLKVVGTNDLSAATLTNVKSVALTNGSTLTLSVAEVTAIGQANVTVAKVLSTDTATLNLTGLGNQVFSTSTFGSGVKVSTITVAAGTTALDPLTSLKGVQEIIIPTGTTLSLTAAQFKQLSGLAGVSVTGGGKLNLIDVTQADVDAGFNLGAGSITSLFGSITLKESVTLASTDSFGSFKTVNVGDGLTLTLPSVAQAGGGLKVVGGTNSTLAFTDKVWSAADNIDASKFSVTTVKLFDALLANQNIDQVLTGLSSSVTKVIYNAAGAIKIDQVANFDAGSLFNGNIAFNPADPTAELNSLTLNFNGGVDMHGDITIATAQKTDGAVSPSNVAMQRLKLLTINSTGTAANNNSGDVTNIINGSISATGVGAAENNLLTVVVNADQALNINGGITFSSFNDGLTETTSDSNAKASITVNGTKAVNLGTLNTADLDVTGLTLNNAGTGVVTASIGATVDAGDKLTFTGSNIKLNLTATRVMTGDVLTGVTDIAVSNAQTLTLTMAQADALGASHLSVTGTGSTASLSLTGLGNQAFAVANYSAKFTAISVTLANDPVVTLNAATSLKGITSIAVPAGTTLNLTAAQFQQLTNHLGAGTAITGTGTVNITDLTQADVDLLGGMNLNAINATVKLGSVTLKESVALTSTDSLGLFKTINVGDNMSLTLATVAAANGLKVVGGANSALIFTDTTNGAGDQIDASKFAVSVVKVTKDFIGGQNFDDVFRGLASSVTKDVYQTVGGITEIDQIATVEAGITTIGGLTFNPTSLTQELHSLTLNLAGGTNIGGDINVGTGGKTNQYAVQHLDTLTINSTGTAGNLTSLDPKNIIGGKITAGPISGVGAATENNLLKVVINADQALKITGGIEFSSVNDNSGYTTSDSAAVATVTVNGTKNVDLGTLNTFDTDVDGLVVNNAGTGTVTATLDSALIQSADALSFTGGKIALNIVGSFDLSDDTLTAVDTLSLANTATLTLSVAQLNTIGVSDVSAPVGSATLNIVGLDSTVLNVTTMGTGIVVNQVTIAAGVITLDPATNLTGVTKILVPEGSTLSMTAAQYQQLLNSGTIESIDGPDSGTVANNSTFNLNITGLTQADVEKVGGFNLSQVAANAVVNITLGQPSVTLANVADLTNDSVLNLAGGSNANVTVTLAAGQTLGVTEYAQANGLHINGGANSTVIYKFFNTPVLGANQIDASHYSITTLKALAGFFTTAGNNNAVEFKIKELGNAVELRLYQDATELGMLTGVNRMVVIEAGVSTPSYLVFNDIADTRELRTLKLSLEGDSTLNGNLNIPTATKVIGSDQKFFDTLTIVSEGTKVNKILGSINTDITGPGTVNTTQNNLLKVVIDAQQDLVVSGDLHFQSAGTDGTDDTASLTLTGTKNVTFTHLDTTDGTADGIATLNIVNNLTAGGTLTVTGNTPAITSDGHLENIVFSGSGNVVFDTKAGLSEGITSATLSNVDASNLTGNLNLGDVTLVDDQAFSFTSGSGVTKLNFHSTAGLDAANNTDAVWTFDLTKAAAGSELHLGQNTFGNLGDLGSDTESNSLVIKLGANATLYIDEDTDLTLLDNFSFSGVHDIVLGDNVTLTLTAAQANGLHIIAGTDGPDGNTTYTGTVNVVGLGDTPVDLTHIAVGIAGTVTLEDNDVTLDPGTHIGTGFTIVLDDVHGDSTTLDGQTIRFSTTEQAASKISVNDTGALNTSSTNVVWLFTTPLTAPINTNGYDNAIGRLWFNEALVNGANVENMFTTLPNTIVRVDYHSLADLAAALDASNPVDRFVELASFTTLPLGLSFNDKDRLEHIKSLDISMGGQVTVGDIKIDNMVLPATPAVDPLSIHFDSLVIRSVLADDTGDLLARVGFNEAKNVSPTAINTVGSISVGTSNGLDLTDVTLLTGKDVLTNANTHVVGTDILTGADLVVGTITFDAEASKTINTAILRLDGANDVTLKSLNVTDVDFAASTIDMTDIVAVGVDGTAGFAGTLTITGASPAIALGAKVETLTFKGDGTSHNVGATITLGLNDVLGKVVNAGVAGAELSDIIVNGYDGTLNLGTLSNIDGTDDVAEGGDLTKNDGLSGSEDAFHFVAGHGVTTATLAEVVGQGKPTLVAGSHWVFDYTTADAGSYLALGKGLDLQAGSNLTLTNVPLIIEYSTDLTQVLLAITGAQGIEVKAGQTLTLTPAQAEALRAANVDIFGAGTLKLVGDGTNIDTLGPFIHTAIVDASLVTLVTAGVGKDTTTFFELNLGDANTGSIGGLAVQSPMQVIGSAFNDAITVFGEKDHSVAGNGGDDTIDTTGMTPTGNVTHNVTAGVDTIVTLIGEAALTGQHDVLIVTSGATAKSVLDNDVTAGVRGFIATAATVNNGTVDLTVFTGAANSKVDMSLATGTKGYNITGQTSDVAGTDTLIGSAFADLINGGNNDQAAGAVDTLTGNGGADTFRFNTSASVPAVMTQATQLPLSVDQEIVNITTADDFKDSNERIDITYHLNGVLGVVTTGVISNSTDIATVEAAIAAALDSVAGIAAVINGGQVEAIGELGRSLTIDSVLPGVGTWGATYVEAITNGTDVVKNVRVDLANTTVTPNEVYTVTVSLAEGAGIIGSYVAQPGDTWAQVAAGIATSFNGVAAVMTVLATADNTSGFWGVTFTDENANDGAFTVAMSSQGTYGGSGASDIGATALNTADLITDFLSGTDKVDLGLVAGSAANYKEHVAYVDFATAKAAATAAMDGTVQYFLTSITGGEGVLFFDANADGVVDGMIRLTGINDTNFTYTDIITH